MLIAFRTWEDVLAHVRQEAPVWYQAPLDYRPCPVRAEIRSGDRIRVFPPLSNDADPFTADRAHLDRFRKVA